MSNGGQDQKELENTLRSTSQPKEDAGQLIDFHDDLKRDLPSAVNTPQPSAQATDHSRHAAQDAESIEHMATLKRMDTDTNSLDEFVDAES